MIKCMIVDDEKPARDELRFLLEDFEDIEVVEKQAVGLMLVSIRRKTL